MIKAVSPGKLILSGEHSVVYGRPAVAMAVDFFAETQIKPKLSEFISFSLLNLKYNDSFTVQTLREVKKRLSEKYQLFLNGKCGIRDVFQMPFELAQFTLANFLDHLNAKIKNGFNIQTSSTIPVGCGMGSSAAVSLSILRALAQCLKMDLKNERYLSLAYDVEKLQHGHPSKLDIYTSLEGGCVYFEDEKFSNLCLPDWSFYIVNTGKPDSTTGECVEHVRNQKIEECVWNDFESITKVFRQALTAENFDMLLDAIKENQKLLSHIGVVSEPVKDLVQEIEHAGGSAKICGAGTARGNHAGVLLVMAKDIEPIKKICDKRHHALHKVKPQARGLHVN